MDNPDAFLLNEKLLNILDLVYNESATSSNNQRNQGPGANALLNKRPSQSSEYYEHEYNQS